jgi:hypothetical protein
MNATQTILVPDFPVDVLESLQAAARAEGIPDTKAGVIRWACTQFAKRNGQPESVPQEPEPTTVNPDA